MTSPITPADPRWETFVKTLYRDIGKHGCTHNHRLAEQIMQHMGDIDIIGSVAFFEEHGGHCDCEILYNVDPTGYFFGGDEPYEDKTLN